MLKRLRVSNRLGAALVSVAVCCLVAVTRPRTVPLAAPVDTDGRVGGRPIAELWVPSRPAHAWFTSAQCRPLLTRFTCDQCLPLVYLASFPRSGNTWLRYLLEASTGLATNETHVVLYERLRQDPMGELRALLRFLQVEPDRRRLECLRGELEGIAHNHRHGVVPDGETYPLRVRAELWSYIHQLHWLLRDRGYPGLPLQQYSFADEFGDINIRMR
ncbi:hypothetical protein FJT64_013902 [Amphibalanus amphitrite]|uniref:Uncharacterized protein n=1 Tax=Amphibalanus amphitrite TaxID=1232801 RepID=A0A6A4V930_AMPAM|nr:hypothetical protein FJT64_013902 [Amphibalanus amphitrite]